MSLYSYSGQDIDIDLYDKKTCEITTYGTPSLNSAEVKEIIQHLTKVLDLMDKVITYNGKTYTISDAEELVEELSNKIQLAKDTKEKYV